MICDGFDEISVNGDEFIHSNGKGNFILSWIIYLSAIFNSDGKSINNILMKVSVWIRRFSKSNLTL